MTRAFARPRGIGKLGVERGAERISAATSRVAVWTIPTDEERTIVRQTLAALRTRDGLGSESRS